MSSCRFCEIAKNKLIGKENQQIANNDDFFSIASIGAFVDGWLLIIPKEHACSMKTFYNEENFKKFANENLTLLWRYFDCQIIVFEHGPNKMESKTACGTNHAHLHLIPYENTILPEMHNSGLKWVQCNFSQISTIAKDKEYLFYSEIPINTIWNDPVGYLCILECPVSQFFRKIISEQLNCHEQYDYKIYPNLEIAVNTQHVLTRCINA